MKYPFLIAETPRAGKWNHRFIVPEGCSLEQAEVATMVTKARANSVGSDYVAATNERVTQTHGGRRGREMLILCGVNVGSLAPDEVESVKQGLESLLSKLEDLVTSKIDWDSEGTQLLVERREPSQWAERFSQVPVLPLADDRQSSKRYTRIATAAITILIALTAVYSCAVLLPKFKWGETLPGLGTPDGEAKIREQRYGRLIKDLENYEHLGLRRGDKADQARILAKIISEETGKKKNPLPSSSEDLIKHQDFRNFVDRIYRLPSEGGKLEEIPADSTIHPLALINDHITRDDTFLGSLIGKDGKVETDRAWKVRKGLYELGEEFFDLREKARTIEKGTNNRYGKAPYLEWALASTSDKLLSRSVFDEFGGEKQFFTEKPQLPVFGKIDLYRSQVLKAFFDSSQGKQVIEKVEQKRTNRRDDLMSALRSLSRLDVDDSRCEMATEKAKVLKKIPEDKDIVEIVYSRLRDFVKKAQEFEQNLRPSYQLRP
jgi:hypothetical protein